MKNNIKDYEQEFEKYASKYDCLDPNIALKIKHMHEVQKIAGEISLRLYLGESDRNKAKFLGLFHDIGRFEQLSKYNTYDDHKSVDHGDLGASILLRDGYITRLMPGLSDEEYDILIMAIKYHNKLKLPTELKNGNHYLCRITRDADKIDIYRATSEEGFSPIFFTLDEKDAIVSDKVKEDFYSKRLVDSTSVVTKADKLVMIMAFAYDLYYSISRYLLIESGYLTKYVNVFMSSCRGVNKQLSQEILKMYDNLYEHLRNN